MSADIVRVLRVYEFTGPRDMVEAQIARSIHGCRMFGRGNGEITITAVTIDLFPTIERNQIAELQRTITDLRSQLISLEAQVCQAPEEHA